MAIVVEVGENTGESCYRVHNMGWIQDFEKGHGYTDALHSR